MNFALIDIVSTITVFLLFLFSVFLLTYRNNNKITRYILAVFLTSKSLAIVNFLLFRSKEYFVIHYPYLFFVGDSFSFLFGPALYFFTVFLTKKHFKIKINAIFHLIPFLAYLTYRTLTFHILEIELKKNLLLTINIYESYANIVIYGILHVHILIYIISSLFTLNNYQKEIKLIYSSISKINLSWLNLILFGFTIIWVLELSNFLLWVSIGHPNWAIYTLAQLLLILFASILVFKGLHQQVLFAGINGNKKYKDCRLTEIERQQYLDKLLEYMVNKKPYLNPSITLNDMAKNLSIQSHLLSQIINDSLQMNFYNFINSYRIEKAKEILSDTSHNHQTILGVLIDVGFNSKSSFNSAFKNFTGLTPKEFKKVQQNNINTN